MPVSGRINEPLEGYEALNASVMGKEVKQPGPFAVRDCALVVLATGVSATDMRELRDGLLHCETSSIYHHFWGRLLQPGFDEPEYNNDFASWAFRSFHDRNLAERLSVVDPTDFASIDELRYALIDTIEGRLFDRDQFAWRHSDEPFMFLRSQIVVFETPMQASSPHELAALLPQLSAGSIFYHFIDARLREPQKIDDFSWWLTTFGDHYESVASKIESIDPYFSSLSRTHDVINAAFSSLIEQHA